MSTYLHSHTADTSLESGLSSDFSPFSVWFHDVFGYSTYSIEFFFLGSYTVF